MKRAWKLTRVYLGNSLGNIVQEDAALEEKRGALLLVRRARAGKAEGSRWGRRFLEDGVALADLLAVSGLRNVLLAAQNDLLEQEDVILPVDLGFGDTEDVVEQECAEVGDMVALPVLDTALEVLDRRVVLRPSLRLVDLISDALCGGDASLELVRVRVIRVSDGLEKRLSRVTCEHPEIKCADWGITSRSSGYLQIRCTGLIRKAGNSPFTLMMELSAYSKCGKGQREPRRRPRSGRRPGKTSTHHQIVLLLLHDLRRHSVVGTIRLVDGEFLLLLFPKRSFDSHRPQYARTDTMAVPN